MPSAMSGVLVVIASPGDAVEERAVVRDEINDWNVRRGRRERVALLPWLWERHSVPKIGGRPQALINAQAVDQADVVVAFFDSRLGTETGVDVSGTAEEINRAVSLGKPVHVYFSEEELPRDVDAAQLTALREFQEELGRRGLLGNYSDPVDLAGQVVRALEADLEAEGWASQAVLQPPAQADVADLRWKHIHEEIPYTDSKGRPKRRATKNQLEVENAGSLAADDLVFELQPVGDTMYHFDGPNEPVTVHPGSTLTWRLIPIRTMQASGDTVQITARWNEAGESKEHTRTITLQ
ncbi:DUF4062 domain-containing protein [Nocardioides rotundus]|uniref:DUF4062 domain-containing protein n=1 Tax=Nocardioides rotundus TaxID=1774216 RepID=UPI001CBE29D8|nr:DUF4062 domain-containing protein [Nocardioides rotundus]UAL29892.1 DUF4062 domain-containing protein [Nocardioides rotundus]